MPTPPPINPGTYYGTLYILSKSGKAKPWRTLPERTELIHDRSDSAKAFRSGFGSFLAFIAGTGLKLVAAIWMICLVWSDTYPVVKNWIVTTF